MPINRQSCTASSLMMYKDVCRNVAAKITGKTTFMIRIFESCVYSDCCAFACDFVWIGEEIQICRSNMLPTSASTLKVKSKIFPLQA